MEVKKLEDYYEQMYKLYPTVDKQDIKRILKYGWRVIDLLSRNGGDICIVDQRDSFWCYMGKLRRNSLKFYSYYAAKLSRKLVILFRRRKMKWDGYYYFTLSEEQYQNYLSQKNKKGRPKKWFKYGDIILYKYGFECELRQHAYKYIFRIPMFDNFPPHIFKRDFTSNIVELYKIREPLKFKDILVTNNNYLEDE